MEVTAEVTPCHKTLQVVGVFLGGLDSCSSGQEADHGKATFVQMEVAIKDARDAKNSVPLQVQNKILKYGIRNESLICKNEVKNFVIYKGWPARGALGVTLQETS
jgi:hypothetical protein